MTFLTFSAVSAVWAGVSVDSSPAAPAPAPAPIVLAQMPWVLRASDVHMRLLWGILTLPDVAGMVTVYYDCDD